MDKINLAGALASFDTYWDPKIVAELNGQEVKLVKFQGSFVWHSHDKEDELFLVVKGSFDPELRERTITVHEGEMVVVPRGMERIRVQMTAAHTKDEVNRAIDAFESVGRKHGVIE